jgi:hypothetical protein
MSLHRRNPKRDRNERSIVAALNAAGAITHRLSAPGVPDLLVGHRGRWLLMEVKTKRGKLEPAQQLFHATAIALGLPCYKVATEEEALDLLKSKP